MPLDRRSPNVQLVGDSFKKVSERLGLTKNPTAEVFSALLRRATEMIEGLTAFFLTAPTAPPAPAPPAN
jgi:hypothetical protein